MENQLQWGKERQELRRGASIQYNRRTRLCILAIKMASSGHSCFATGF